MLEKKKLKNLLLNSDFKSVFDELEKILAPEEVKINDYINLRARYNKVEQDKNNGIITTDYYYKELSILRLSCLGLIDELSDVTTENFDTLRNYTPEINDKEIPRLEIELVPFGKWKHPLGLSRNNKVDKNGAVWITNVIYNNEIGWKYKLIVRNNSSYPAFYPEMKFEKGKFNKQLDKLNKNKAILPFAEIELNAKYSMKLEAKGRDAIKYMDAHYLPDELKNLSIILKYKSEQGNKLMSRFKIVDDIGYNEMIN